jgi:hypothetical protein
VHAPSLRWMERLAVRSSSTMGSDGGGRLYGFEFCGGRVRVWGLLRLDGSQMFAWI